VHPPLGLIGMLAQPGNRELDGFGELRPAVGHRTADEAAKRDRVGLQGHQMFHGRGQQANIGHVIVAFSVSPLGGDDSVGAAVAEAIRVVRASGLPNETNAMFTNIEGEWDEVMAVVKQAVDAVAAVSPRVSLVLKADIRPGYTDQLTAKVQRVERELGSGSD
jgi:uncharacterized protein (TIGR00106 family)